MTVFAARLMLLGPSFRWHTTGKGYDFIKRCELGYIFNGFDLYSQGTHFATWFERNKRISLNKYLGYMVIKILN